MRKSTILAVALLVAVIVVATPFVLAVIGLVTQGSWPEWTGFGEYSFTVSDDELFQRGKTLWDVLELLIVPIILAVGALFFNQQARQNEEKIAEDHNREEALQKYLDKMTELLIDEDLRQSPEGSECRSVARSRTLTTLRTLDGTRKGLLLRFLYESKLLDKGKAIIRLKDVDLSGADLGFAHLNEADLYGADLYRADLSGAHLNRADLRKADLSEANLLLADLSDANLAEAILDKADLSGAHLNGADLRMADLSGVDLRFVHLSEAKYNIQTKWPGGFDPLTTDAIFTVTLIDTRDNDLEHDENDKE